LDNIDKRMMDIHVAKIAGARAICDSLYEGFAPVVIEGVEGLEAAKAAAASTAPLSEEERVALVAADAIVAASAPAPASVAPAAPAPAAPAAAEEVSEDPI
jgi:hypothetical protein